jgi:hypothetical protein
MVIITAITRVVRLVLILIYKITTFYKNKYTNILRMGWSSINYNCQNSLSDLVEVRGHPKYESNLRQYASCEQTKTI